MNDLIWLVVGLLVGAGFVFFVLNYQRHKERLENEERIKSLKLASEAKLNAEIELVKRRVSKTAQAESNEKLEKLAADLFPVIDAMHMAMGLKTDNVASVKDGVRMVYDKLDSVLQSHGCVSIHPEEGDLFDPEIHQAVACHGEPIHVVGVKRVGFRVGDKVLRAAAVEVGASNGSSQVGESSELRGSEEMQEPVFVEAIQAIK